MSSRSVKVEAKKLLALSLESGVVSAERVYYARRVLSVQQSQFNLARNAATTFPVTFRLLPSGDSAYAGQEYGKIIDRVLTVTA
jgi:non-canonical (house-cleaning) NTP pyrophosphatase